MAKKPSIQSIISSRRNKEFIGRKIETDFFTINKEKPFEERKFVFNFYGQGGIGKTTLTQILIQKNEVDGISIYTDENQSTTLDILSIFHRQLTEKDIHLKKIC